MKKIKLSEKLLLSSIVQGFWRLDSWNFSKEDLASFMNKCIELDVTTFDTAEIYAGGACESMMGEAFSFDKSIRNKVEIVSKTGISIGNINGKNFTYYDTTYKRVKESCHASLKRLNTDYIDLYLIHREDPCIDFYETARALIDLKKEGLIIEAGVSNFDPYKFNALNNASENILVTNQIELSPVCFEHFKSGMIDVLTEKKIHPMIWSPLAGGNIFTSDEERYKKAFDKIKEIADRYNEKPEAIIYAWIMHHPVAAVAISGSSNIERLGIAVHALDIKIKHSEWYEIYSASGEMVIR